MHAANRSRPRRRGSVGDAPVRSPGPPECPGCAGGPLDLFGPQAAPELLLGHCDECGALYMVEGDPVVEGVYLILGRCGLMQPGQQVAQAG